MQVHAEDSGVGVGQGRRKGSASARLTKAGPQGLLGYEEGEEQAFGWEGEGQAGENRGPEGKACSIFPNFDFPSTFSNGF